MAHFISGLRFRLIVLVLLAVVPAFGVILYSAARHRDLTASQVQRNALGAARAIAAEQERFLENAHQLLIMLARLPQLRETNKTACRKILGGLLEPLYADLALVDPSGNLLCGALPSGASIALAKGLHHRRVVETHGFSAGKIRTHAPTGKAILDLAYPVLDSPGVLRAVAVVAVDLSWVTRITAGNHLYTGATFTLVDGNGIVLLRYPQHGDWVGHPLFAHTSDEGPVFQDTEKTVKSLGADRIPRLFAFSQLKGVGVEPVYATIDIPATLAFADADRILVQNLITLGCLSALTLMAAWFGADLFVLRRIRDLMAATKQIAVGQLGARTRMPYGRSELGQLARAFDDLAQALQTQEAEAEASARQIQKQRQQQQALYDLNLAITSTLDLSSVLSTLLEHISALFPSSAATISWINKQTGTFELIAQRNLGDFDPTQLQPDIETGLPLLVLQRGCPLAIADAQVDPRITNPEFFRRQRFFSYLGLPLTAKGETPGVLSFYTRDQREFSAEEMSFLTALLSQAAIAIHNSHLYQQTRNQAIELEKSNKIKDEFLGVMSHELRTPLNIIMNYAEALKMGTFGEISRDQEKGADKIRSQAGHLLTLINGILEITKIETGTVTLQTERFALADFVSEHRSDYMMPMENDIVLKWEYPPDLPVIVSDRTKLKQILTNLINNAIKFTEHGSVTVSVDTLDHGDTLEFKVGDTGPGIPEELVPFVFDKFRQIDSTTTRNHSGAGLGLYIVKTFVELLDGTITVQSNMGEGSVFTVRLPIKPEECGQQRPARPFSALQEL